ncbi:MAG: hypothetical protein HWD57_15730 [Candidatus Accumulibacter cognatus]|uniref:Uncharacterized protein n=1 Tax=Candidatus Accumulibacter cognatus TaxID=2954383 RepID=A0A7D5SQH4_9PROT|nr:MAG: hypothetical protein HWD57_15730 [Candidatus Accumulibacter cognatus]
MKRQTLLGILGTLILGALGSGLWELIKPGFSFLGSAALAVISLGLDSVVSDIYTRVGRADIASTWIKGTTLMIFGTVFYAAAGMMMAKARAMPVNDLTYRRRSMLAALALMLVAAYIFVGGARHAYVAKTRGYFEYLTRVAAPYMTVDERLLMDSKLALIKSRSDYEKLAADLKLLLKTKNITVAEDGE